ncbi:outer membrane protein assembly factor BamD [Halobacteriovorax sp. GB3]|uniref:outer membrane protein assembly factor BamD n=1 Tax=Halobacteriovorax sp. GB3 TaxID=2719615 RepID=UPI00236210F1|nr:outer membrane protein assembly factor BamD [Halobacteriovorax sp. GB3]MDD0854813.1 outer membrane protein assembly factor BamD [Halobacteriovorax sp. GB3]
MKIIKSLGLTISLLSALLLGSCAVTRPEGKTEAEVLFKEAQELVNAGRYLLATEKLRTIRSKYSYSLFNAKAELLQADILYMQESYVEAAAAYIIFRDFHTKYTELDYVLFRIAESYYNQIPETFDRDLSAAHMAIQYYTELLRSYRASKYLEGAKTKIEKAKQMIRNKEKYIADFYYKTEKYNASKVRYEKILKEFPDREDLRSYAIYKHMQASYMLEDKQACLTMFEKYQSFLSDKEKTKAANLVKECETLKVENKNGKN